MVPSLQPWLLAMLRSKSLEIPTVEQVAAGAAGVVMACALSSRLGGTDDAWTERLAALLLQIRQIRQKQRAAEQQRQKQEAEQKQKQKQKQDTVATEKEHTPNEVSAKK